MKRIIFTLVLIATIIAGGWMVYVYHHSKPKTMDISLENLITQGDNALNIGRYNEAKQPFEDALKINPDHARAAWGLKKSRIKEIKFRTAIKLAIDELYKENPDDSHVNLLLAEFYVDYKDPDKAQLHLEKALNENLKLAEAHFLFARLHEQQAKLDAAKNEYLLAIEIAPTPKYRSHLAHLYIKQRHFEAAITEFDKNTEHPLSPLETAKIYWHHDRLDLALIRQLQAINWLEDEMLMAKPENQDAWVFTIAPDETIELTKIDEKKSYALFNKAITLYLLENAEEADVTMQQMRTLNVPLHNKINTLIESDLNTLLQEKNSYAPLLDAFRRLYL